MTRRALQLLLACIVLGAGVALLLDAALGSDGYAALVNGISIASGIPFWIVNIAVGVALIGAAWVRGTVPGPGTLVQPVVVGVTVSLIAPLLPTPADPIVRGAELGLALLLLAVGVAGYLAADLGAGPMEAAAIAWDPPVPFRWNYTAVQAGGALIGWLLGAAIGPGTLLVVFLLGPAVAFIGRTLFAHGRFGRPATRGPSGG